MTRPPRGVRPIPHLSAVMSGKPPVTSDEPLRHRLLWAALGIGLVTGLAGFSPLSIFGI